MPRTVSQADQALSDDLNARGLPSTPRRVESMRSSGLLQSRRRVGLGQGPGSRAIRPGDEVERAVYMTKLVEEVGGYANAVLVAFVRDDYPIVRDRLERAYRASYETTSAMLKKRGSISRAGTLVGRYIAKEARFSTFRDQIRAVGLTDANVSLQRAAEDLGTDLVALVHVSQDEPHLTASAAESIQRLAGPDYSPETEDPHETLSVASLLAQLDFQNALKVIRKSSMDELRDARDAGKTVRIFAREFAPLVRLRGGNVRAFPWYLAAQATDLTLAYAIPMLVLVRRSRRDRFDQLIVTLIEWTPFFEAANTIIDQVPTELQVLGTPLGTDQLTDAQVAQLREHLAVAREEYPEAFSLVENPPQPPATLR